MQTVIIIIINCPLYLNIPITGLTIVNVHRARVHSKIVCVERDWSRNQVGRFRFSENLDASDTL